LAPRASACRENNACGKISPKRTIRTVDIISATKPPAISPRKIAAAEFTATLPTDKVHKRRFIAIGKGKSKY